VGTLVLEFGSDLTGVSVYPLTIRATGDDERHLPIIGETKIELVQCSENKESGNH
jgi:hypothetical protein